jgi:hypothetical protein
MTTAIERRLREVERLVAALPAPPEDMPPWISWLEDHELDALEAIFYDAKCEQYADLTEADQARAASIAYAAEARRLAGEAPRS